MSSTNRQAADSVTRHRRSRFWLRTTRWRWAGLVVVGFAAAWWFRGSFAPAPTEESLAVGEEIFLHEWTANDPLAAGGDGLGPVFNERSCVACHCQGGIGGGGTNDFNVLNFEVQATTARPDAVSGVIHASAVQSDQVETFEQVRARFPVITASRRLMGSGDRDFDPLHVEPINTPPLFGLGLLDDVSDWTIHRQSIARDVGRIGREFGGDFTTAAAGRIRRVNGSLGKFGWKGQFSTLEDFVATACAVELGLSNPLRRQDRPRRYAEDENAGLDIDHHQLRGLVDFVRGLPRPEQILPTNPLELAEVHLGEALFSEIGCADCHSPSVGGVDGVYSDLMLHTLTDPEPSGGGGMGSYGPPPPPPPEPKEDDGTPSLDEWKTPPLWGVADSAPYMHDGSAATLEESIRQHAGNGRGVRDNFFELPKAKQRAVLAFLSTLRAPPSAVPAPMRHSTVTPAAFPGSTRSRGPVRLPGASGSEEDCEPSSSS